jgi:Helicase conserved C-terminal domain/SNF2-related domain
MSFGANIEHDRVDPGIEAAIIDGQLRTAEALEERLREHGGVILGDEVGSGKTYVTFALLVETLASESRKGAAIFVPSGPLKTKWCEQLREYIDAAVPDERLRANLRLRITPIDRTLCNDGSLDEDRWGEAPAANSIVVATHTTYSYRTSVVDRAACLRAAAARLNVGHTIRPSALLRACELDPTADDEPYWADPDLLTPKRLEPLRAVLLAYVGGERDLDFEAREAIAEIRLLVGRARLPNMALAVIDEAHHLKSTDSTVYRSLSGVLGSRFDALLFLTATPFQLGRDELLNIVGFFAQSRANTGDAAFEERVRGLAAAIDRWVDSLDDFMRRWADLDQSRASTCASLLRDDAGPGPDDDPLVSRAAEGFRQCLAAKAQLEEAMRPFLVRSVRDRFHREHGAVPPRFIADESRIPLALVDRLLTEQLRERRTFISSALVGACSSWQALGAASIMDGEKGGEVQTRPVLRRMIDGRMMGEHPKVAQTVDTCVGGVDRGEKTLVFVERRETGQALREEIVAHLAAEEATHAPSDAALRQRLQDRSRFGWPSLRENYLHTIMPLVFGRQPDSAEVAQIWGEECWRELWWRVDPAEEKRDYSVEKRFWEHAFFTRAAQSRPGWEEGVGGPLTACARNILDPAYILNGIDLLAGDSGSRHEIPDLPVRADRRGPRMPFAEAYVAYRSPWFGASEPLSALGPDARADFVDAAASTIAVSHFRDELAALEVESDPAAHFTAVAGVLLDPHSGWPQRFQLLAEQAREAVNTQNDSLAKTRIASLIDGLKQRDRVQFVDGNTSQQAKENVIAGFNTPLYPDVIITTEVLAEGLDLHRYCRRVIHHDLPWNPAKLEQRTGRVDRVGSLSERLRAEDPAGDHEIDVWLPFVPGTYDEFIYQRVLARRREFRCILGDRPEWHSEELHEEDASIPIDPILVERLQVDLGPRVSSV